MGTGTQAGIWTTSPDTSSTDSVVLGTPRLSVLAGKFILSRVKACFSALCSGPCYLVAIDRGKDVHGKEAQGST